ncbi:hypothetical protein FB567DRAFT_550332 [Paraphoma chrysanthemicola]|uniref:Uncharacterized protein n=1 Tax=Paraphoma chrysanthemicola TaxID=798071 RepID=A0A8K0VXY9_9PLEO|nr:hypothetical protein FB567DRAFT_550332 [Paraphoma chrysanthemicola]
MARCAKIPEGVTGRAANPDLWTYNTSPRKHHQTTGGKTGNDTDDFPATAPRRENRVNEENEEDEPLFSDTESSVYSITAGVVTEPPLPVRTGSFQQAVPRELARRDRIGDTLEEYDRAFREEFGAELRGEAEDSEGQTVYATGYEDPDFVEKDLREDLFAEIFEDAAARREEDKRDGTVWEEGSDNAATLEGRLDDHPPPHAPILIDAHGPQTIVFMPHCPKDLFRKQGLTIANAMRPKSEREADTRPRMHAWIDPISVQSDRTTSSQSKPKAPALSIPLRSLNGLVENEYSSE